MRSSSRQPRDQRRLHAASLAVFSDFPFEFMHAWLCSSHGAAQRGRVPSTGGMHCMALLLTLSNATWGCTVAPHTEPRSVGVHRQRAVAVKAVHADTGRTLVLFVNMNCSFRCVCDFRVLNCNYSPHGPTLVVIVRSICAFLTATYAHESPRSTSKSSCDICHAFFNAIP